MKPIHFTTTATALAATLMIGCVPTAPSGPPTPTDAPSTPAPTATPAPSAAEFTVRGTVYDDDRNPLAGATVTLAREGQAPITAETDASGQYAAKAAQGDYAVTAAKAGFTSRTRQAGVQQDVTLDFGGQIATGQDPYFLSDNPEISEYAVEESSPGGPFTFRAVFSEPLTAASQAEFNYRFFLNVGGSAFLSARGEPELNYKTEVAWTEEGRVFTLKYAQPRLVTGTSTVVYEIGLRQDREDDIDPETGERLFEDMEIADAEGNPLGKNRAAALFLEKTLPALGFKELADKGYGKTPADRRWNLTHFGPLRHITARDDQGPGLESVRLNRDARVAGSRYDVLELRFTEPMRVVKDADEPEFTRLDEDKEMAVINVSKSSAGSAPQPLGAGLLVQRFRFSRTEPNLVYFDYPVDAFKDFEWVEVTLGKDLLDPAGNKADDAKRRAIWKSS